MLERDCFGDRCKMLFNLSDFVTNIPFLLATLILKMSPALLFCHQNPKNVANSRLTTSWCHQHYCIRTKLVSEHSDVKLVTFFYVGDNNSIVVNKICEQRSHFCHQHIWLLTFVTIFCCNLQTLISKIVEFKASSCQFTPTLILYY